ncbi:hypothetical protein BKH43_02515 [Helicobacter sp. 13S00401-1]|uniref:LicD family protein n=1 Tax=Helicobacter sp. 13S00401-1 TaxID=1905758 RepID=UPI000BC80C6D|nr:LicD family protein [Helicobacter sp. 13S00401-1]PAF51098.1 hypothetical protein BKH43_02515 [Helicobacter sp. 13S00401-1]
MYELYNFLLKVFSKLFIPSINARLRFRKRFYKVTPLERLKKDLDIKLAATFSAFFDIRDIRPATGNLRKVQLGLSALLSEFHEVCMDNDIIYWLDYGTLLGAYRHKGFIPWDDDIDVGMMRSEFLKLQKALLNHPHFKLTEWLHIGGESIQCRVAKFCFKRDDIHLFIDIFPYDFCNCSNLASFYEGYKQDKEALRASLRGLKLHYNFCECKDEKDLKVINETFKKYGDKYSSSLTLKDGSAIIYGIENPVNEATRIFTKHTIFPLQTLNFEGFTYLVPNDIDKYLSVNFGNYMALPTDIGIAKHPPYTESELEIIEEILHAAKESK